MDVIIFIIIVVIIILCLCLYVEVFTPFFHTKTQIKQKS